MSKELTALSNGTYTLAETGVKNQFYFYRNDREVLGDVGRIPMDFYQNYIINKMMEGEIQDIVMNNIRFEESTDGKCIRITVYDMGEEGQKLPALEQREVLASATESKPNFFKHMLKKIFGK